MRSQQSNARPAPDATGFTESLDYVTVTIGEQLLGLPIGRGRTGDLRSR